MSTRKRAVKGQTITGEVGFIENDVELDPEGHTKRLLGLIDRLAATKPDTGPCQLPAEDAHFVHDVILSLAHERDEALKALRSAECVVRQVAEDTFGEPMTVKEFADASSYDS